MDKYKGLTDKELLERLKKYSIPHGPIVGSTRILYEKKVYEHETERTHHSSPGVAYTEPSKSESYVEETFVSPRSKRSLNYGREGLDEPAELPGRSEKGGIAIGSTRTSLREAFAREEEDTDCGYEGTAFPQDFQTFVFLDVETTGLPHDQPRVAELSLSAVHRRSLQQCSSWDLFQTPLPPRILDKLTLCVDPQKPFTPVAEEITGLSSLDLKENCKPAFNSAVVQALLAFLERQAGPVCLVAHNGFCFDFPLLRTELYRVEADLLPSTGCLDTLPAFKQLDKTAGGKYRLEDLYQRFYGQAPVRPHSAEGDVLTLLLVFLAKAPALLEWAAVNARSWAEIEPMYYPSPKRA